MPVPRRRSLSAAAVGLLALALAFLGTVQLRSQVEVRRTLEGQDPAALAFLIDQLHTANDRLNTEVSSLAGRRAALRAGDGAANQQLADEAVRLRILEGSVPVRGPGVTITIDAPLTALDLEDAVNGLRLGGAEAVSVNDRRIVTGTVFRDGSGGVALDGAQARGPWTLVAIGDPARLQPVADAMTRSLRSDPRVRQAGYRFETEVVIRSTTPARPFVYGSS